MRFAVGLLAAVCSCSCRCRHSRKDGRNTATPRKGSSSISRRSRRSKPSPTRRRAALRVPARVFSSMEEENHYYDDGGRISRAARSMTTVPRPWRMRLPMLRRRGRVRFDEPSTLDGIYGHQLSIIQTDGRRVLIQLYYYNHKLYIAEGNTAPGRVRGGAVPDFGRHDPSRRTRGESHPRSRASARPHRAKPQQ